MPSSDATRRRSGHRNKKRSEKNSMSKYQVLGVIGEGAYGVVMKCRNKATGEVVAMKKFKESGERDEAVRKTIIREVKVLKEMRHIEPVVQLYESFRRKGRLYLVFEFIDRNLLEVIEEHPEGCPVVMIEKYMYQLLGAILECHSKQIIHRDIKPENLLIKNDGILKLCDFGFARHVERYGEHLTDYVATRWYRAPELLVGDDTYGPEVDMWAIACIMAELADGDPLFPGDSEIDQLFVIQKMLGPITKPHMKTFLDNPRFMGLRFPDMSRPDTLNARYHHILPSKHIRFMNAVMAMEPKSRLTVEQCLDHHVFDNVRGTYPFISKRRAELDPHRASSLSPVKSSHRRGGAESKTRGKSLATAGVDLLSDSLSSSRGHKKNMNFSMDQRPAPASLSDQLTPAPFAKAQSESLLPDFGGRGGVPLHGGGEKHRRTKSEAGASMGVPGHKQVASFSSTGSQDGSFDFGSSNFRGINEADFLLPDAARSRSMTESSSQSVSPTPMTHRRMVSSDFSDSAQKKATEVMRQHSPPSHGIKKTAAFSFGIM